MSFLYIDYVTKTCYNAKLQNFFWQNLELLQLLYGNSETKGWIIPIKQMFSPTTLGYRIDQWNVWA